MEEKGRSGLAVVPPEGGLLLSGSQTTGDSALFLTAGTGGERDLDSTEAGFREDMSRMLQSERVTGTAQQGKAVVRHSRGVDWIMGILGMRVLLQRRKLEKMPVAVRDEC